MKTKQLMKLLPSEIAYLGKTAWVKLFVMVYFVLSGFFFTALLKSLGSPASSLQLSVLISQYFMNLSNVLLFFCPLLALCGPAAQYQNGTHLLYLLSPLNHLQMVTLKFVSFFLLLLTIIIGPAIVPVIYLSTKMDITEIFGQILTAFFALLILGQFYLSLVLAISAIIKRPILAALCSYFTLFIYMMAILSLANYPNQMISEISHYLNFFNQLEVLFSGTMRNYHMVYFLSGIFFNFLVYLFVLERRQYPRNAKRYYAWFSLFVVTTLSLASIINYIAYKYPVQFDFSFNKTRTLTAKSKEVAAKSGALQFILIANQSDLLASREILELYRQENPALQLSYLEAKNNPAILAAQGIQKVPVLLGQDPASQRQLITHRIDEWGITQLLHQLQRLQKPRILFTQGLGELPFDLKLAPSVPNVNALITTLNQSGFEVDFKSIFSIKDVKDLSSYDAVAIVGPLKDIPSGMDTILNEYLQLGRGILIAKGAHFHRDNLPFSAIYKNLHQFLIKNGISFSGATAIDLKQFVQGSNGMAPVVTRLVKPTFLDLASQSLFFPLASTFSFQTPVISASPTHTFEILAQTTPFPHSYAKNSSNDVINNNLGYADGDVIGPLLLAGTVKNSQAGQLALVASSDMVQSSYQTFGKNIDFILQLVSQLATHDLVLTQGELKVAQDIFIAQYEIEVLSVIWMLLIPLTLAAMWSLPGIIRFIQQKLRSRMI